MRTATIWKQRASGGILAIVGFLLSPLSWWNDLVVNLPLAIAFAWVVALFYEPAFETSLIIGYWLTNVLGFVLMHKGLQKVSGREARSSFRKVLLKDLLISLVYTGLIILLLLTGVLRPVAHYFPRHRDLHASRASQMPPIVIDSRPQPAVLIATDATRNSSETNFTP